MLRKEETNSTCFYQKYNTRKSIKHDIQINSHLSYNNILDIRLATKLVFITSDQEPV